MTPDQQAAVDFRNAERDYPDDFDNDFSQGDEIRFCLECEEPTTNHFPITDDTTGKKGTLCRICQNDPSVAAQGWNR